jgi:hypothetical protein
MNFSFFIPVSLLIGLLFGFDFLNASSILQFDIRAQIAVNEVSGPIFKSGGRKSRIGNRSRLDSRDGATGKVDG